jgi:hypothetical protein
VPREGPAPEEGAPVSSFVITVDVPDLEKSIIAVQEAGGQIVSPKQPVVGVGWLAYLKDTKGNIFGAMRNDESAA